MGGTGLGVTLGVKGLRDRASWGLRNQEAYRMQGLGSACDRSRPCLCLQTSLVPLFPLPPVLSPHWPSAVLKYSSDSRQLEIELNENKKSIQTCVSSEAYFWLLNQNNMDFFFSLIMSL